MTKMPAKPKESFRSMDDFDDMLAEFQEQDVRNSRSSSSGSSSGSGSGSGSSSSSSIDGIVAITATTARSAVQRTEARVTEYAIIDACVKRDVAQLRRWGRQGVRVESADLLRVSADLGYPLYVIRCLIQDLGADVNQPNEDGATALLFASKIGRLEMVRSLVLEFGADVNQARDDGIAPLLMATFNGHLELVYCMVKHLGADVNQTSNQGYTPLCFAIQKGRIDIVRCLVEEFGADVNKATNAGATTVLLAVQDGRLDILRFLLKSGADVDQPDFRGMTPLMVASYNKLTEIVTWLVKAGASTQTASTPCYGSHTAVEMSRISGASIEQTAYLEAKTHCLGFGCSGTGLLKCTGCKQARYCGQQCQLAHWKAHKADCKRMIRGVRS